MTPLVYIAGPYTRADPVLNTHLAIKWAEEVEACGCDVVIPHLSLLWHIVCPAPLEKWYARDIAVLARCDALVRFPGASTGADAEVAFAAEHDVPAFIIGEDPSEFWSEFRGWLLGSEVRA